MTTAHPPAWQSLSKDLGITLPERTEDAAAALRAAVDVLSAGDVIVRALALSLLGEVLERRFEIPPEYRRLRHALTETRLGPVDAGGPFAMTRAELADRGLTDPRAVAAPERSVPAWGWYWETETARGDWSAAIVEHDYHRSVREHARDRCIEGVAARLGVAEPKDRTAELLRAIDEAHSAFVDLVGTPGSHMAGHYNYGTAEQQEQARDIERKRAAATTELHRLNQEVQAEGSRFFRARQLWRDRVVAAIEARLATLEQGESGSIRHFWVRELNRAARGDHVPLWHLPAPALPGQPAITIVDVVERLGALPTAADLPADSTEMVPRERAPSGGGFLDAVKRFVGGVRR